MQLEGRRGRKGSSVTSDFPMGTSLPPWGGPWARPRTLLCSGPVPSQSSACYISSYREHPLEGEGRLRVVRPLPALSQREAGKNEDSLRLSHSQSQGGPRPGS